MRIDRLELTAYGCFTNAVLDFSVTGRNMVVVYGPNEAGKSTALNAIRHWLFGFERSVENIAFRHKSNALRVRGTVSDERGGSLTATRRKGNKETLFAADGTTVLPEGAFDPFLHSITPKQFEESFGLNLNRLKAGGRELAAGEGNLGEALFAAAAGVMNLRSLRAVIAKRKDSLFAARAVKATINADLRAYSNSKQAWEASIVPAAEADRLELALAECVQNIEKIKLRQSALTAARNHATRVLRGRALVLKYDDLLTQREPLRDVVPLASSFAAIHSTALAEFRSSEARIATLLEQLETLDAQIADSTYDEPILAAAERITALVAQQSSVKNAESDLNMDMQRAQSALGEAKQALRGLGLPLENPEGFLEPLRLNDREKKLLRNLASDFTRLTVSTDAAEKTLMDCRDKRLRALECLANVPQPADASALVSTLEDVGLAGDLDGKEKTLQFEIDALSKEIDSTRKRLGFSRTFAEITTTKIPSAEVITYYSKRLEDFDRESTQLRDRRRELEVKIAGAEFALARVDAIGSVPGPVELRLSRQMREEGWALIRTAWLSSEWNTAAVMRYTEDAGTPESLARVFENTIRTSDVIADRLTAEADRVRERLNHVEELRSLRTQLTSMEDDVVRTTGLRAEWGKEWLALWTGSSISPGSPHEMLSWRREWDRLSDRVVQLVAKQTERERVQREIEFHADRLRNALTAVGQNQNSNGGIVSLGELIAESRRTVKGLDEAVRERRLVEQRAIDAADAVRQAEIRLASKQDEKVAWDREWVGATARLTQTGLTILRPDQLDDVLEGIEDFFKQMNFRRGRLQEMSQRQLSQTRWRNELNDLADQLDEGATLDAAPDPFVVQTSWATRLKAAESARDRLRDLTQLRDDLGRQRPERELELSNARDHLDRLVREARVGTAADLPESIAKAAELRELDRRIESEYRVPIRALAVEEGSSVEELERRIAEAAGRDLRAEIDLSERDLSELERNRDQASRTLGEVEQKRTELFGRRGGIDDRERMEAALTRIRQNVPEYATLVLAEAVLARAIERYREKNKSELFEVSSRLFGRLTCGRFIGLDLEQDDHDEQTLVGVRPESDSSDRVPLSGMSDGTCDQLYLALRLAHLDRHVSEHGPFPVIVDDLLLAFDDTRARAALNCLADLSRKTQIIFFSHHAHLRDMARETEFEDRIGVIDMASSVT